MPRGTSNTVEESYLNDDLFDYDADIPDIDTTIRQPTPEKKDAKKDNLGLDEEVKIKKKRINVKLDEARLLREDIGIPKLRREAPKRLKFKGKGHEYRDAARLLSYYQLWADDLYKKAKFRDTLQIIEKLGHSRRMKMERENWIMESKKKTSGDTQEKDLDQGWPETSIVLGAPGDEIPPNDDELYSRPTGAVAPVVGSNGALFLGGPVSDSEEENFGPDDDELDALMDEMATAGAAGVAADVAAMGATAVAASSTDKGNDVPKVAPAAPPIDEFADEMEAMAELGDDW
ncbi:Swi3-domain-containing protein [Choiromyces venosus 120613-1]|uniref:Chromosome segregation in meiosis protein n=1 Tax=Choiromyces venosus 120613-1 TaxID=1336337 RepID=A0A3N4JM46_9PEZI|nr:Swi3-domain-containing protein [Choiromyces venosus 120613-1]